MRSRFICLLLIVGITSPFVWGGQLLNGPMLTHTTMHSVQVWVQTEEPLPVFVEYWEPENPEVRWTSAIVQTNAEDAGVAKLLAREGIEPGHRYAYRILSGETRAIAEQICRPQPKFFQSKPRWRFVPDSESGSAHSIFDFRIAMASCTYINEPGADREGGRPYGGNYEILDVLASQNPDLMLWLGDNVYYRENDYESREGLIYRWTYDRQTPGFQAIYENAVNYAVWDDHDYGPNDIGRNYPLKAEATEVFQLMWGNPGAGLPETPGIFTYVNWGDANIYLLDNRTYQAPRKNNLASFDLPNPLLGRAQVDWLIDQLIWTRTQTETNRSSYPSRFNLIVLGNQALNASGNPHGLRSSTEEWQYLMDRIVAEDIRGVVFLTGDVHFGEVNKIEHRWNDQTTTMLEVTSSPLTAGSWAGHETNPARFDIFPGEADRVGERNFVTLDFRGPLDDREMVIRFWNSEGTLLNQKPGAEPGVTTDASVIRFEDLQ